MAGEASHDPPGNAKGKGEIRRLSQASDERSPEHDFGGLDFAGQQMKPEVLNNEI